MHDRGWAGELIYKKLLVRFMRIYAFIYLQYINVLLTTEMSLSFKIFSAKKELLSDFLSSFSCK